MKVKRVNWFGLEWSGRLIGASKIPFHSKWDNKFFPSSFSIDSLELALISAIYDVYLLPSLFRSSVFFYVALDLKKRPNRAGHKATSLSLSAVCRWSLRRPKERVITDILDPFKYEFNYGSNFISTYLLSPVWLAPFPVPVPYRTNLWIRSENLTTTFY